MKRKIIISLFTLLILGSVFWPVQDPSLVHLDATMQPPTDAHIFGTDNLGRDLFGLMMKGCNRTLLVVCLSTTISLLLGITLGLIVGYKGGIWAIAIQFITDFTLVVPSFILALIVSGLFGLTPITAAIVFGVGNLGEYCNQSAALTRQIRHRTFVESEIALGIPVIKILYRHVVPNIIRPLLTFMSVKASGIAIQYASLTYIGLGSDISNPDWGTLLYQYRGYILTQPMLVILPASGIFLIALFFHLTFDDIEDSGKDITLYD